MERKIGEIFEYNGKWYQCIIGHCNQCSFNETGTCKFIGDPYCAYRNDKKLACFKKLEKVGEPYLCNYYVDEEALLMQPYRYYGKDTDVKCPNDIHAYIINRRDKKVAIEIKQKQEDMEENKLNLKPFDLEAARSGKPVCTRDGRKARIICFDCKDETFQIVALVGGSLGKEEIISYDKAGYSTTRDRDEMLMMLPEKKEGWVNVYKERIYSTKEEAIEATYDGVTYVDTIKISWEE